MTLLFIKRSKLEVWISNVRFYYQNPVIKCSSGYPNPVLDPIGHWISGNVQISKVDSTDKLITGTILKLKFKIF
jgi:hypothetical protein